MAGLMDFFRSAPAAPSNPVPPAQAAVPTNGNPPVPAPTTASPGGNAPVDPNAPIQTTEPDFSKLWEAPAENDPKLPEFNPSSIFNIDPAKIAEAAKGISFNAGITDEQKAAIVQGGEGALKAMMEINNSSNQQAFQLAMIGSAKMIEQALGKANDSLDARMAEQIRKNSISHGLKEKNPILASPEYAPMVQMVENQLRVKFPNSSAQEITDFAEKYVLKFASGILGKKDADSAPANNEPDWEKLFFS